MPKFSDKPYEKQAHRIVDNAIGKAPELYRLMTRRFNSILNQSTSFAEAQVILENKAVDEKFMRALRSLLFDGMTTEDALARSQIIEKDIYYSLRSRVRPVQLVATGVPFGVSEVGWISCQDSSVKISFDVIPREVIDYLREKSFWVAGIENDAVLKAIQKRLRDAAAQGLTYRDWLKDIELYFEEYPKARPQTVFRTNLYSAYSAGQLEQMSQMRGRFPMWRYIAILDSVTRHAELNDTVWLEGEGPYPPIDYNCRCTAQHLHTYQVNEDHITSSGIGTPLRLRRFNQRSDFEAYRTTREAEMSPDIRRSVMDSL